MALSSSHRALITRFAPSPTGYLHAGHAYAARVAWQAARESGGKFLLRLEDIDTTRCRPEFAAAILDDLRWLGLHWDGPVLIQSSRMAIYAALLDDLRERGLLYPCFCSRADIARAATAPHGPDAAPLYPGTCRHLSEAARAARIAQGAPHSWRLDMERALHGAPALHFTEHGEIITANPAKFGDVVLGRRDTPASYHLCVTCDDAAQGVTLVTRSTDLLPATHLHRLLQHLFRWTPPAYAHHAVLTDSNGERLSKRNGAMPLRQAGRRPKR